MPTFAFLLYGDSEAWTNATPEEVREGWAAHEAYGRTLAAGGGTVVGGSALKHPSTAQTVRRPDLQDDGSSAVVTDGPYAEVKEVLGGFYLVEAPSLQVALELARQCPEPVIEVRPVMTGPDDS